MDSESPAAAGGWRAWAVRGGVALFTLQFAVAFGLYFETTLAELVWTVRVFADPTPWPGLATPLRVGLFSRASGHADANASFRVTLGSGDEAESFLLHPEPGDDGIPAGAIEVDSVASEVPIEVTATSSDGDIRTVRALLRPSLRERWLDDSDRFASDDPVRRMQLQGGIAEMPGVRIRAATDACPLRLVATPQTGVVARMVDARMWLRLLDAAGAPVAGVGIEIEPPAEGGPAPDRTRVVTDPLGVASFRFHPLGSESWTFRFPCDGGTVERVAEVIPSWDGALLWTPAPTYAVGEPWELRMSHQRDWGRWSVDVWCDGGWLLSEAVPIREGESTIPLRVPPVEVEPGSVRLCFVQGTSLLLSADPPRSAQYVLVRGEGVSERQAISMWVEAARRHGGDAFRADLGAEFESILGQVDETQSRRLGQWLASRMPQPFQPLPLLVDDFASAERTFREMRALRRRKLRLVMGADAAIFVVVLLGYVVPNAIRQHRRMQDAMRDHAAADGAALDDGGVFERARGWIALVIGLLALLSAVVGMAFLVRAMA